MDRGKLNRKIQRRLTKMRLKPIRVFCFHQVSDVFEPDTMWECDWTQTEVFKKQILALKKKYTFISLTEACKHIANDKVRFKNYAALTADDGWASVKNIIPWLAEQQIPLTLFLNPLYLDGEHFRERLTERFLLEEDITSITERFSKVSIGMHGWEHIDVSKINENEFRESVDLSVQALRVFDSFIPYYAYPWGKNNEMNKMVLKELNIVPVLMDGQKNYNDASGIHRELLFE